MHFVSFHSPARNNPTAMFKREKQMYSAAQLSEKLEICRVFLAGAIFKVYVLEISPLLGFGTALKHLDVNYKMSPVHSRRRRRHPVGSVQTQRKIQIFADVTL